MAERSAGTAREMNAEMTARLLAGPPQPLEEGGLALRVLHVPGRRSGRPQRTPLGVTRLDGHDYLVSPEPGRDWVRNVEAAGGCELLAGGTRDARRAVRASGAEAARAVARYLANTRAPWVLSRFPVPAGATPEEVEPHLAALAVFRLEPGSGGGR
ncbi:hypothetical protein Sru01_21030 [Sphaerisporangium rufum]|uniref:Nitroreductase family deazaflavin-dependent oxidoreductase n=1 Tax=Sphaerisporangium rufum TaxID=1381558 RepID=A0A919QZS7_9ACTN|nr:nitroreductase family deazaflavin-dependent oxidoreductase [Sphaerisporangium rufum]GII77121.1 hypothetical protein Sru01_21030 [Sphaerisporangium rufum]